MQQYFVTTSKEETMPSPNGEASAQTRENAVATAFGTLTDRWLQLAFQEGPIAVLVAGGAVALSKGLIPAFDLKQATFGTVLLLISACFQLSVWLLRQRTMERQATRAQQYREA